MPVFPSRKRQPAPSRDTKEAERAAKKIRQVASKAAASDTPKTAVDQGTVGGDRVQSEDPIPPSPPRSSDPISAPVQTLPMTTIASPTAPTTSPIMTTTSPIATTNRSTSPPPTSPRPSSPQLSSPRPTSPRPTSPQAASAPPSSAVVTSSSEPQASPPRPTKESVQLMRSVEQFRAEYSRTGHVGKESDASYQFPVTSHGPMNSAYNRLKDFAIAMTQDLQQIDRNHAVRFYFALLFLSVLSSTR